MLPDKDPLEPPNFSLRFGDMVFGRQKLRLPGSRLVSVLPPQLCDFLRVLMFALLTSLACDMA